MYLYIGLFARNLHILFKQFFVVCQIHPDPKQPARNLLNGSSLYDDMPGKGDMGHKPNSCNPAMSASYRVISTSLKKGLNKSSISATHHAIALYVSQNQVIGL